MKNRSGEPDARSDVRGRGKINVDGAASQALHGFQRGKKSSSSSPHLASTSPSHAVTCCGYGRNHQTRDTELVWEHLETIRLGGEGGQE